MKVTYGSWKLAQRGTEWTSDPHIKSLQRLSQCLGSADDMLTIQQLSHYRLEGGPEQFEVRLVEGRAELRLVPGGVEIVKVWRT